MNDFFVFIIGGLVLLVGIYLFIYSFTLNKKYKYSESWPHVDAIIIINEPIRFSATTENYNLDLKYQYTVKGKTYTGNQAFLYSITTKKEVKQIVREYPKGSKVNVFYDPENPKDAVLETGGRKEKKNHEIAMACIVVYIGLMLCFIKYEGFRLLLPKYFNL